jgi:hypothetical protein
MYQVPWPRPIIPPGTFIHRTQTHRVPISKSSLHQFITSQFHKSIHLEIQPTNKCRLQHHKIDKTYQSISLSLTHKWLVTNKRPSSQPVQHSFPSSHHLRKATRPAKMPARTSHFPGWLWCCGADKRRSWLSPESVSECAMSVLSGCCASRYSNSSRIEGVFFCRFCGVSTFFVFFLLEGTSWMFSLSFAQPCLWLAVVVAVVMISPPESAGAQQTRSAKLLADQSEEYQWRLRRSFASRSRKGSVCCALAKGAMCANEEPQTKVRKGVK